MFRLLSFAVLLTVGIDHIKAETLIGTISKAENGKMLIQDPYTQEKLILKMQGDHAKYLDSFIGYKTYLKFTGEKKSGVFIADRTPVIVSSPSRIEGILKIVEDKIFIGDQHVLFNEAAKVNGTSFNIDSIKFFNTKKVIANGRIETGIFHISAIVPANLYSADVDAGDFKLGDKQAHFDKNPSRYVLKIQPKNENSQTRKAYKAILMGEGNSVTPGTHALVVTLSGRQGDDLGSASGHFAVGIARVKDDLSLEMEIHNYYPTKNEKQIIPGFIDYVDYFGGMTSGQTNYRPTYTMIIYGEGRERLLEMRDSLDDVYSRLRLGENSFSISSNCTTVSIRGLNNLGIRGEHQRLVRKITEPKNLMRINPFYYFGEDKSTLKQLSYALGKNAAYYVPRPAFDSLLRNLNRLVNEGSLEGLRVDYIFQNQTPSDRIIGGTAANQFLETVVMGMKDSKHQKKPYTPEQIFKFLNKID